ncbi:hypothetical protein [Shimia haliotis]|uniref:Argininosuccinate lyase n=1 Tax=Shimia haliotis TaxID=1280847 RepID=A0A1I4CVB0_9RHOB|nr:hypothetical protein [Shimia haliotis]SFK83861.1 hypothetical protein SAMN04488036_102461 [Shimia haliotis]
MILRGALALAILALAACEPTGYRPPEPEPQKKSGITVSGTARVGVVTSF